MLIKSLIGILGLQSHSKTEWTYVDKGHADVLIFDYDDGATPANSQSSIIVGFSRDINLLKGLPFSLHKPLRSRDLLGVLTELDEHLTARERQTQTHNTVHAKTLELDDDNTDPLDIIFTLIRNNSHAMFSLHFDDQVVYLDSAKKKIFSTEGFSYASISKDSDFQYYSLPSLPDIKLTQISIADFFYEFTLSEKPAHLLTGLNSNCRFQIKQWPNFAHAYNTKAVIKISAYFSKQKATLQTAAQDLSLDAQQLFGFINAVHAQNLLIFDSEIPKSIPAQEIVLQTSTVVPPPQKASSLFGRIRQRLGL